MRSILFSCMLLASWMACKDSTHEQPSLTDEKIARVMADLYVADAATSGMVGYPKDSLMKVYYAQVFEMHNVTQPEYEKNLRLVADDLERLKSIILQSQQLLESKGGN